MSRPEVHTNTIAKINLQGVTSAMLLQCTEEQQEVVVEYIESGQSGPSHGVDVHTLVESYIRYNEDTTTQGDTMTEQRNEKTKARRVGNAVGTVPGVAGEKVVRAGIAAKRFYDETGKDAAITGLKGFWAGLKATAIAAKDVTAGAIEGGRESYNKNKATRK